MKARQDGTVIADELFYITFEQNGGMTTAHLEGELDLAGVDTFWTEMSKATDAARGGTLVVDLRGLNFMDSSGIRVLLELHAQSQRDGFELSVINGDAVRRVLQVSGVEGVLPLRDTEDEVRPSPAPRNSA